MSIRRFEHVNYFLGGARYVEFEDGHSYCVHSNGSRRKTTWTIAEAENLVRRKKWREVFAPTPTATIADRLISLQSAIHELREDTRDDGRFDARLNAMESQVGEMVSEARGENQ